MEDKLNLSSVAILKLHLVFSVRNAYPDLTGAMDLPQDVAPSTPAMMQSAQTSHSGRTHPAMSTVVDTSVTFAKGTLVSVTTPGIKELMRVATLMIPCMVPIRSIGSCPMSAATNQTRFSL